MNEIVNKVNQICSKHVIGKLRTLMLLQGGLWIVASVSLFWLPDIETINVVLTSLLGVMLTGWGLSLDRKVDTPSRPSVRPDLNLQPDSSPKNTKVISA